MSAANSRSRAASAPDSGTSTSRSPAASMSGTSNPALRRNMLGMPSSSSRFWISSASDWFRPPATRTSGPRAYSGLILRARSRASLGGGTSAAASSPASISGMPQSRQKSSSPSRGYPRPQLGQTSPSAVVDDLLFRHAAVRDLPRPQVRVAAAAVLQRDDQVGPVRVLGDVDVGLRGLGRAARMRVVDAHLVAVVVELVGRLQVLEPEVEGIGRVADVLGLEHLLDHALLRAQVAAALVRSVALGVGDDRVALGPGHPHGAQQ